MELGRRWVVGMALSCALLVPIVLAARQREGTQNSHKLAARERMDREREIYEKLIPRYKSWLDQDVASIITLGERRAFLQLASDEAREQFIEFFWEQRNPNPELEENTFEEEHYRRILYANEHYGTIAPGWKTDRGRVYVTWGPPDEIESSTSWDECPNPPKSEEGSSKAPARETWRYMHMEGAAKEIKLYFVYVSAAGDYFLSEDSCDSPEAVVSQVERDGPEWKIPEKLVTGIRTPDIGLIVRPEATPKVKFKDLEVMSTSHLERKQVHVRYQTDLLRGTEFTSVIPITIEISESELHAMEKSGRHVAEAEVFGRVTYAATGRVAETFEDTISGERGGRDGTLTTKTAERYEKNLVLRIGTYRLDLVVKDVASGNVGVASGEINVPWFEGDRLETSSLILGDRTGADFKMTSGLPEVRPRLSGKVTSGGNLDAFLQVYGLKVDEKSHGNSASIIYTLRTEGREVWREVATTEEMGQRGEEVTIERVLPVSSLGAGKYWFGIEIDDHVATRITSRSATFEVRAGTNKVGARSSE